MQRLFFEKQIDLNHALQELISISVNENLAYQDDQEGKRAIGTLEISGEYLRLASKERFNDQIEIDVLAPFDRLEEQESFYLEVHDFDYHIQNGDLHLEIQVLAHGVGEKKERHIVVSEPEDDEMAVLEQIRQLVTTQNTSDQETTEESFETSVKLINEVSIDAEIHEEPAVEQETIISEQRPTDPIKVDQVQDILQTDSEQSLVQDWQESESIDVDDLFDDDEMAFVTYPIYIVQAGDTYEQIARKYQVDEERLRSFNQSIPLTNRLPLMIPPQ